MEDMADDPTLMDCCRREMVQNRKNAALLEKLRAVDISNKEANIRSSVWGQEQDALPPESDEESLKLTSDEDDDADDPGRSCDASARSSLHASDRPMTDVLPGFQKCST